MEQEQSWSLKNVTPLISGRHTIRPVLAGTVMV